jgi:cysteine desulfurase/selenocysteine lyase
VERIRQDFPILSEEVHGRPLVYLDNAATTQKPRQVLEAIQHYYATSNANVHRAAHELSERATRAYEGARVRVQQFLGGGNPSEIIFVRGATEAINLVAQTFGRRNVRQGDEIIISHLEHHSNIVPWQMLCEEKGAKLRVIPVNDRGELVLAEYERLLSPRTRLVAVAHVSNALGTINPARRIIELAHGRRVPVLLDGAQAAPHLDINVRELDVDFYAFSGHKIYGPTGIGVLYGKASLLEGMPPWQGGGDMISQVTLEKTTYNVPPHKFEAGTPNVAGAVGLAAALDYLENLGHEAIAGHEQQISTYALQRLGEVPGLRLVGTAADRTGVISLVLENPRVATLDVGTRLDLQGIAVRTGHHCCMPLMDRFGVPGTVRASFGMYNSEADVDRLVKALERIVAEATPRAAAAASVTAKGPIYPRAAANSPAAAAQEIIDLFDFFESWSDRHEHLLELGQNLPPMPDEMKTEDRRVRGCMSTVHLVARIQPGTKDVIEFLADSDAHIVRGLIALLQRVYSGQRAAAILAFDIHGFFRRLGLEQNLSMGRRNGLADMVKHIRQHAAKLAAA